MKKDTFLKFLTAIFSVVFFVSGLTMAFAAKPDGKLRVRVLDVGQGDAILIQSPTGKNVLFDAGDVKPKAALLARLNELVDGPLDMVVMSHPHADHIGGMPDVLRKKGAKLFLDPGFDHASKIYADVVAALEELAIPVRLAQAGRKIDIGGGASIEILSPALPFFQNTRSDVNANSVVARLTFGSVAFFLAADSEAETEQGILKRIVQEQGRSIQSTVYKVAHHGSRHASSDEILEQLQPEYAVFSVGADNRYGHPTPEALDRVIKSGAKVYRTDENGEVVFISDGKKVVVKPERGGVSTTKPVFEKEDPDAGKKFVASAKGKSFHVGTCRMGKKIAPKNKITYLSLSEAKASGKNPARCCLKADGTPKEEAGDSDKGGHSKGSSRDDSAGDSWGDTSSSGDDEFADESAPAKRSVRSNSAAEGGASDMAQGAETYVSSKNSKKFHKAGCKGAARIKESNRIVFKTRSEAEASGRTPAADCKP